MLMLLQLLACGNGEEVQIDYIWDMTLGGVTDECNDPPVGYQDSMDYALTFSGSAVEMRTRVTDAETFELFANGMLQSCTLEYESTVVGEDRPGGKVQWQLTGEGAINYGDGGCEMESQAQDYLTELGTTWEDHGDGGDIADLNWVGM